MVLCGNILQCSVPLLYVLHNERVIHLVFSLDDSFVQKRSDEILEHQSFSLQVDGFCFGEGAYYADYDDKLVVICEKAFR